MFFHKGKRKVISIEGMDSEQCIKKIEMALENLVDVSRVKVDFKKKYAIIWYDNTLDEFLLQNTIENLGYIVTGIREDS